VGPGPGGAITNSTVKDAAGNATLSGEDLVRPFCLRMAARAQAPDQGERSEVVDLRAIFNGFLNDLGRKGGRVTIPVTLTGCAERRGLTIRSRPPRDRLHDRLHSNEHPRLVAQVRLSRCRGRRGARSGRPLQYFTDAEGDRIRFPWLGMGGRGLREREQLFVVDERLFLLCRGVLREGHLLDAYSRNASWRGTVRVDVCVNDAAGCADWARCPPVYSDGGRSAPAGMLPASTEIFAPGGLTRPRRHAAELPPCRDAHCLSTRNFVWYLDGEVIGPGSAVGPFTAGAGSTSSMRRHDGSQAPRSKCCFRRGVPATLPRTTAESRGLSLLAWASSARPPATSFETGRYRSFGS